MCRSIKVLRRPADSGDPRVTPDEISAAALQSRRTRDCGCNRQPAQSTTIPSDHLMTITETTVDIATPTGPMRAMVFCPNEALRPAEEGRKYPGLVLYSEI